VCSEHQAKNNGDEFWTINVRLEYIYVKYLSVSHKVRIYKENHSVCSLVGIGTLPTPLSPASVPLPLEPGGAHSAAGEGLGLSQFRRLEKSLRTLPTLWCLAVLFTALLVF
jgi:hypothetical protein